MAWSSTPPADTPELPRERLLALESNWLGAEFDTDRWIDDMRASGYELYLEFMLDEDRTLYRFELDEDKRAQLRVNSPHWQNVVLSKAENARRKKI